LDIAAEIAAALSQYGVFAKVTVAKPGLVNMRLPDAFFAEMAQMQAASPDPGVARTAMREPALQNFTYGKRSGKRRGPNVDKRQELLNDQHLGV
jgi:hypothetical protein